MEDYLKNNIDPFNKSKDDYIISILKKIGFEYTESDNNILNRKIKHRVTNLSVGEK